MGQKINLNFHLQIRWLLILVMSIFYLYGLFNRIYITPFELESDYLQYFNFYYYNNFELNRFGSEIFLPAAFGISKLIGFGFFDFCFVFGAFWLLPIVLLSKNVKTQYIIFYFLFFIFYFLDNFSFLMRQYFAFMFVLLYLNSDQKIRYCFLLLAFASHLSSVFFLAFALMDKRGKGEYYIAFLVVLGIFLLNQTSFINFSSMIGAVSSLSSLSFDLYRKLAILDKMGEQLSSGATKVYFLLIVSAFLHCVYLYLGGKNTKLLALLFFSAMSALLFSDFNIISNRIGFASYFFSIPYLLIILSLLRITATGKLRVASK